MKLHHLPVIASAPESAGPPRHLILISLNWTRDKDPRIPLAQASLLASAREAGIAVTPGSFAVNAPGLDPAQVIAWIEGRSAAHGARADVGLGVYVWNEHWVQRIVRGLRARGFAGRIILGGPQISYAGAGLEALYPGADVFVRGFGERALAAIMRGGARAPIPGVHWAGETDQREQARVALDRLPSPYLTGILDPTQHRTFLRWETQRGCPFRCSFCQHRAPVIRGRPLRYAAGRVAEEARRFSQAGVRSIAVLDPVFNLGDHPLRVLDALRKNDFSGQLSLQCHFAALRRDFLEACAGMDVRLEFGLQTIHEQEMRAIDRVNKLDRVVRGMSELRRRKIAYEVSLIFGLPNQTLDSFRETVAFCLERQVPVIKAYPLMLLRGTRLARERARWSLVESADPIPAVIESASFDQRDWREMAAIAEALRRTEGRHPATLARLMGACERTPIRLTRWSPPRDAVARDIGRSL